MLLEKLHKYISILLLLLFGCQTQEQKKVIFSDLALDSIREAVSINSKESIRNYETAWIKKMTDYAKIINIPQTGDWLDLHSVKVNVLFDYVSDNEVIMPNKNLAIVRIGSFSPQQDSIYQIGREYLEVFFGSKVILLDSIPFPASIFIDGKLNSSILTDEILPKYLPENTFSLLAITSLPITPSPNLNYAFGQSSLTNGCSVVSLSRLGAFSNKKPNFHFQLLRSMKVASHEVGHSLKVNHCATFECGMNGVNHLNELDRKPAYLCPFCLSKLCWKLGISEEKRFALLQDFWKKYGFEEYESYYDQLLPQ